MVRDGRSSELGGRVHRARCVRVLTMTNGDGRPFEFKTLQTAAQMADKIGISEQRLLEFVETGQVPHYRVDGGPPMFRSAETRAWATRNLLHRVTGEEIQFEVRITRLVSLDEADPPPASIALIENLVAMPDPPPPGIYFLCVGNEVVYVGKSVNPASRIESHLNGMNGGSNFRRNGRTVRAYLLPVPRSELEDVEIAFIHALAPEMNVTANTGVIASHEQVILERFGLPTCEVDDASDGTAP